ncbi:stabilizer of axonemal microtubules 1 isoform X2 [Uranotaenia lowii]|nr:stabilizer of axonemal microtubules 1 isoform X2 [Uranotaenia lowii]
MVCGPAPAQCQNCACGKPDCVPKKVRYIQPPRREPCKPVACYRPPVVEFSGDSVYKTSFNTDPATIVCNARPMPITPRNNLAVPPGCLEKTTVTSLSYPAYGHSERQKPVLPSHNQSIGGGPMQEVTTTRHDYVPKSTPKRVKIIPEGHIRSLSAPFEKETVNKLSFGCPNMTNFTPAVSCKPVREYTRSEIPMASETTAKLSYPPVSPGPKEIHPWARRASYQPPDVAMANDTTYKKSYMTNSACASERVKMIPPFNNLRVPADSSFESKTVYKESYYCNGGERPAAIRPVGQLHIPSSKLEDNTVYKLSFPIYCNAQRPEPVLPRPAPLIGQGPIQEITTTRHDFVCKSGTKREPIVPQNMLHAPTGRFESDTVQRLSFPANKENIMPPKSCKPITCYKRSEIPMESETTNKLSFMPVSPAPKEIYPWARRACYQPPDAPMASETTAKLSYQPPGIIIDDDPSGPCCQTCNPATVNCCYPRAAIVS